ncbi:guanine nucleotide-binding protein alpha-8 subunit [Blastocladiella britannica]|nr:guanine nucleotide-binding protein alpha-8 subunit [Blastocladiella britannica]
MPCCGGKVDPADNGGKGGGAASGKNIDAELREAGHREKLNLKLLLLGSGESGKSTVLKQIKLINKIQMTAQEIQDIAKSLRKNGLECIIILVNQAATFGYPLDGEDIKSAASQIGALDLEDFEDEVEHALVDATVALWKHDSIQKTIARRSEFWILEAVDYYMENFPRFAEDDFEPSEEDCIMARTMTVGILQTEVPVPPLQVTLVDVGGQRNERRKWVHMFDNVSGILFLSNLAGYNSVLFEDPTENRMKECLTLFQQTVNNPMFAKTPFYLIFNKKDLFESKIRKDPITVCPCFVDYSGTSEDVTPVLKFIEDKFRSVITSGDPNRLMVFNIAARFKRDVKHTWEDIIASMKTRNRTEINGALKALGKEQMS